MIYREDGKPICTDCKWVKWNNWGICGCMKDHANNIYLPIGCKDYEKKEDED